MSLSETKNGEFINEASSTLSIMSHMS